MPRPVLPTSQWSHPSDIEAYIFHLAQRLGTHQAPDCSRTMLVQVWQGDNCSMEFQVVKCGTSAQTNGCPLPGAKGPILNKVDPLAAPFATTPSQPPVTPMSRSHGPSASVIVAIIAVMILATTVVLLFLWDYQKRERARREMHDGRENQTVVIQLENYNGRLEHRRVTLLGRPHAQPSVQRGRTRADSVVYLPDGLQMSRRPEAAARVSAAGRIRVAEDQTHTRASEETAQTLVASVRDICSVTSDVTLRDTETEDDSSEMEGETSASDDTDAEYGSSETDSETSTAGRRQLASRDDIAGYRSWRSAE